MAVSDKVSIGAGGGGGVVVVVVASSGKEVGGGERKTSVDGRYSHVMYDLGQVWHGHRVLADRHSVSRRRGMSK